MKIRKTIITLLIVALSIWNLSANTFAMQTGFTIKEVSDEDRKNILSNIDLKITTQEPKDIGISCFDVSDNEMIAIGRDASSGKFVYIYDTDGTFQYGYSFNSSGSFNIEWDNENIIIYFVRSNLAASFDKDGNNIELKDIDNTSENYSYWRKLKSTERVVNNNKYTLKCDMGLLNFVALSYSQVVKTDSNGDVTMIYDVNTAYLIQTILILIVFAAFVSIVIGTILYQYLKNQKTYDNHTT